MTRADDPGYESGTLEESPADAAAPPDAHDTTGGVDEPEDLRALERDLDLDSRPYRSISDVAGMIGVKPHVLRYWETQFGGLRPKKNRAGNRMYRPDEIRTLLRIKDLLYARRFTIEGAKKKLQEERHVEPPTETKFADTMNKLVLHEVKSELRRLASQLRRGPTGA